MRQQLRNITGPLARRSFPIYESVHNREGCPKYQRRLLQTLAQILPAGCIPILVADAGFRRPWIKAVEAQGWYHVGRIRNRELCRSDSQEWRPVKNLYALATTSPKSLGYIEMTQSAPHFIHLYCVRHSAKGPKHQRVTGSIAKTNSAGNQPGASESLGCSPAICRKLSGILRRSSRFKKNACRSKKASGM